MIKLTFYSALLVSALALILAFTLMPDSQISAVNSSQYQAPKPIIDADYEVVLKDISAQLNITQEHRQSSDTISAITESLAAGVCVLDFDNDGWMDIFLVGGSGHSRHYGKKVWWGDSGGNRLLRNDKAKQFVDVSQQAGITLRHWSTACAVADLDNDNDSDIIVTGYKTNLVYENLGNGQFAVRNTLLSSTGANWSVGVALNDFNDDGLIDIYLLNLVEFEKGLRTFEAQKGFTSRAVDFSPELYDAQENSLLINKGNWLFEKLDTIANNRFGRSLFAKWHDINNDNLRDLIVLNDFGSANQVYLQQPNLSFIQDNQGVERLQQSGSRNILNDNLFNHHSINYFLTRKHGSGNVLLQPSSQDSKQFLDRARQLQLTNHYLQFKNSWGAIALDINNDGWLDIYTTSGQPTPDPDSQQASLAQANDLFINFQGKQFIPKSGEDPAIIASSSRGVASIDINNDGKLELLIANNNGPLQVLKNSTPQAHHWLGIVLPYSFSTIKSIEVTNTDLSQSKIIEFKQSLFSQSDPRLHFGLGENSAPVTVSIEFNHNGTVQIDQVHPDKYYQLSEDGRSLTPLSFLVKPSPLELLIGNADADSLKHLFSIAFTHHQHSAIYAAWRKLSVADKVVMLTKYGHRPSGAAQMLVRLGLQEDDARIVEVALNMVRAQEWDWSVKLLVKLLEHPSDNIRCNTANLFEHMYIEEEAATRFKYSAIAPLVKALATNNQSVQLCLLNALAAAEHKRSVGAILPLLSRDYTNAPALQAAAIRALGLIRDRRAISYIVHLAEQSAEAKVIASSLIALNRLGYISEEQNNIGDSDSLAMIAKKILEPHISSQQVMLIPDLKRLLIKLKSMEWLMRWQDGVVFSDDEIQRLTLHFINQSSSLLTQLNTNTGNLKSLMISASEEKLEQLQLATYQQIWRLIALNPQLEFNDYWPAKLPTAASFAAATLAQTQQHQLSTSQSKQADQVIPIEKIALHVSSQSDDFIIAFFSLAREFKLNLPLVFITTLAKQNIQTTIKLITSKPEAFSANQFRAVISQLMPTSQYLDETIKLIKLARTAHVSSLPLTSLPQNMPEPLMLAFLHWFFQSTSQVDTQTVLKARILTNQLLQSPTLNSQEKLALLISAAHDNSQTLETLALNNQAILPAQLLTILNQMPALEPSEKLVTVLANMISQPQLPKSFKFNAIALLAEVSSTPIDELLTKL